MNITQLYATLQSILQEKGSILLSHGNGFANTKGIKRQARRDLADSGQNETKMGIQTEVTHAKALHKCPIEQIFHVENAKYSLGIRSLVELR